jgi:hypothetical protein
MDKLTLERSNHKFFSQTQETDGRKINWYIIVDKENPDLFTWIRKKGNLIDTKRNTHSNHNQQHFTLSQNPETGNTILEECKHCKEIESEETILPETCNMTNKIDTRIFYCDLLNQTKG